jgi:hypothetical protein
LAEYLRVHIGGSCRKLDKQVAAFEKAGISLVCSSSNPGQHWSNQTALMLDSPEARALLKKVGGTVCREQFEYLKENKQERMF